MADFFCTFLNSRSFTSFSLFVPQYKPPKPFSKAFSILASHNPTISSSRRRKLLNLTVLSKPISHTPSSPDFDLVSTSECSDGSFVFRFGDPSEIERIEDLEEPNCEVNVVKVLDSDPKREVIVKTIEREVRSSSLIEKELDICGEDTSVNEKESDVVGGVGDFPLELSEKLLEVSQEGELHVCVLDIHMKDSSSSTEVANSDKKLDVFGEDISDNEKESDVMGRLGDSLLESSESSLEVSQQGELHVCIADIDMNDSSSSTEAANSDKRLDVCWEDISDNEKESDVVEGVGDSRLELHERMLEVSLEGKLPVFVSEISTNDSSSFVLGSENAVHTREGSLEEDKDESSSSMIVSVLDSSLRVENGGDSRKVLEKNNGNDSMEQSDSGKLMSIIEVPQSDAGEESSQETVSIDDAGIEVSAQAESVESPITFAVTGVTSFVC